MRRMTSWVCAAFLSIGLTCGQSALAAFSASATITGDHALSGGGYEYDLSLTNTGGVTDPSISTFWFGWIVFAGSFPYDLLPHKPGTISSPASWSGVALQDGITNGQSYGIEWKTSTAALAPGQTLSGFVFDSPDAPPAINDTSFFDGYPVRESWAYQNPYTGVSTAGANFEFTPSLAPTPEPTFGLLPAAILLLARRRKR